MLPPRFRLALCVIATLTLALPCRSQAPLSQPGLRVPAVVLDQVEGNWEVTATDSRTPGKTTVTQVSLWKVRQLLNNGSSAHPGGEFSPGSPANNWSWRRINDSEWVGLERNALTYSGDGSFALKGYGRRVTTLRPANGHVMSGRWTDGDAHGEETWRRLVPRITAIEYIGTTTERVAPDGRLGRLRVKYEAGDGMRGNKRAFNIKILGENLGGTHYARIEGADIEGYSLTYIRTRKSGEAYGQNLDFGGSDPITGRTMEGYVWSRVTPGIKRLHFDDLTFLFQLEVEGMPTPDTAPRANRRDPLALDGEDVIAISTDPQTGILRIVRRNADGSTTVTHGQRALAPDGTEHIVELDEKGNRRETAIAPDGSIAISRSDDRATKITTTFSPDGSVDTLEQEAGGASSYSHRRSDGVVTSEDRDASGTLIATTTRHPDGLIERADPEGNLTSVRTDDLGRSTAVTADGDGTILTVVTNAAGVEEHRERIVTKPLEPGRVYFEDVLNGTDWNALPDSLKHRYADSETQLRQTDLRHAEEDALAAKQRAEAASREAADAKDRVATTEQRAAIRAEQEAADRRAVDLRAQDERRREVETARDQGKALQRNYYEAIARGDQAEATRILNLQDEHEAATMDLMKFTPAENREMLRAAGVREALLRRIAARAVPAASGEIAYNEGLQDTKDAVTNVTRFGAVGSQMQHETSRTTRSANRERTAARARLSEIDQLLTADTSTAEERKMLEEIREVTSLQEQGASELLAANSRITAAGYMIDAALIVSGGTLAKGATRAIGGTVGVIAGEGASRATVAVLNRSALELAGQGATRVATGVATRVAGDDAAKTVAKVLASDVSTPAAQAAGAAARRLVGNTLADATVAFTTRATEVATTDVSAVPGLLRDAAAGRTAAAETRAATTAAREAAATTSAAPTRAADGYYAPEELEALHQPGRNLTPEEIQRKADLYRMRERARAAAVRDVTDGKPVSDIAGPAVEYRNINNAINNARAAHGLPPIAPPRAPVAGPARSLLPPVAEAKPVGAGSQPLGASTVIERPAPGPSTARAAAETVIERPPVATATAREAGATTIIEPARPVGTERLVPSPAVASAREAGTSTIIERAGPTGTERIVPAVRAPVKPVVADVAPRYGNPTMGDAELRSFAEQPRVRTQEAPSRLEGFSDLSPVMKEVDPIRMVQARTRWMKLPRQAKSKLDAELRAAIDEAAAMGDKWARRLQTELNGSHFNFRYEPGLDKLEGVAVSDGRVMINPLDGERLRSGDELASTLLHEYVHSYHGPRKLAVEFNPDFAGVVDKGQYGEGRAFLAESIFNRNLRRARALNGRPFDPRVADTLNGYMRVGELPAGAPNLARGNQAMANLQDYLVDRLYTKDFAGKPADAAAHLAAFRGGSVPNTRAFLQKKIREAIVNSPDGMTENEIMDKLANEIRPELLKQIEAEGGRFLPHPN